jgi:hypothetical protein
MDTRKTVEIPAELLTVGLPDKFLRFLGLAMLNPELTPKQIAQTLGITDKYALRIERALVEKAFLEIQSRTDKSGTHRRYVFPSIGETASFARAS